MPELAFDTTFNPAPEEFEPINHGLYLHNLSKLGPEITHNYWRIVVSVKDEGGRLVGGLIGEMFWDWLHIETLWVAENHRGQDVGSHLVRLAEESAREKGFHHSQLETTSFQALEFYQKNGYQVFASLEGKPPGHTWYYLKKDIEAKWEPPSSK
jgi:ribosomal protein S18 acetylase RimI-like enzyme